MDELPGEQGGDMLEIIDPAKEQRTDDLEKDELPKEENIVEMDELSEEEKAEILERCEKYKVDGNEHFGNGRWKEAEDCYSLAIESSTTLPSFNAQRAIYYSNRAAARIKLELWDVAIEDYCNKAEELGTPNNKPLERRAYARLNSNDDKHLDGALEDYKKLIVEKPNHKPYLEAKALLDKKIAERNEKLKDEMFSTLKNLGNMCLRPFGLSTESFELVQNAEGGYSVNMKK
uniref:Tetratricopeptide repeat protein 1 n=1 Tax=Panagrolaimus sp. ES5 TaxID=591445 RepID=A0AC34G7W8_9BILA